MTDAQQKVFAIQKRMSLHTSRFGVLERKSDRTATEQSEFEKLDGFGEALQIEYRSALDSVKAEAEATIVKGTATDAEGRELLEKRDASHVGEFVSAALGGRSVTGVELEFSQAMGCPAGSMPLSIFDSWRPIRLESRDVTPGVSVEGDATPTVPYAFSESVAARVLGMQFPVVAAGTQNIPVIVTAPPSGAVAKDGSAIATAAAVRLDTRTPKRIAGQFEIRTEDSGLMPTLEADISQAMMASMSNSVDEQVIAGNGVAPNLTGLFKIATDEAKDTTTETFVTGVARFAALIDGQYAFGWSDLRGIVGSDTFGAFSGLFAGNGSMSLSDYLQSKMGGFAVSNRVPSKASSAQKSLVVLTGGPAPNRCHVWQNIELLSDPYTQAGKGIRTITATILLGDPHVPYGAASVKEVHPKIT